MVKQNLSYYIIFSFLFLFIFSSCQKRPEAGFQLDNKNAVYTGDEVILTNTSTDGYSFLWDFGDGTSSEEMDPVKIYDAEGSYNIVLTVFSKNKRKSDIFSLELTVLRKKEIVINGESYSLGKGYLYDYVGDNQNKFVSDIVLVNKNIHMTSRLSIYVYDRNVVGNILFMSLRSEDEDFLSEGLYTSSASSEPYAFLGSFLMLDIEYFSGEFLYYESFNGTVDVNVYGETYEFEINMYSTAGENIKAYFIGHLTKYEHYAGAEKLINQGSEIELDNFFKKIPFDN